MASSYQIGQGVKIKPVVEDGPSLRASEMLPYSGKTGVVADFHWIAPPNGQVFYLYTVRVDGSNKEVVLYEDEVTTVTTTVHGKRKS